MPDVPRVATRTWDPEGMLDELTLESQFDGHDAQASVARILRENAVVAAHSLAHLSLHARSEYVRAQSAQYLVDQVLAGNFDHDKRLAADMIALLGNAFQAVVRGLALRFDFDPEDAGVKAVVQDTLLELTAGGTET